jgi:prolyl-tRNA synthetase
MNAIDGQEILMNVLQPKELWQETGRWEEMKDVFYYVLDKDLALAPTHEEQVTDIVRKKVKSYKDLPFALYQIQTKFRAEARAKSGLLRGREFIMKDPYSFHADEKDLDKYYDEAIAAYKKVFKRFGLEAKVVEASGGVFTKYSHEFQVLSSTGEDTIFYCEKCDFAQNKEIAEVKEGDACPKCGAKILKGSGIEVGNIFKLKTKYSDAMGAKFLDKDGKEKSILMGCYGIGLTRSLGTAVEVFYNSTKNKMVWPKEIAPYKVHLLSLQKNEEAEKLYDKLIQNGAEVLYDDRDVSNGEKFAEADLIGCPKRVIVSEKSLKAGGYEFNSEKSESKVLNESDILEEINE